MTVCRFSLKALTIGVLSVAVAAAMATPANAAPDHGDYTRSIQMSWDGTHYADTTVESFFGLAGHGARRHGDARALGAK